MNLSVDLSAVARIAPSQIVQVSWIVRDLDTAMTTWTSLLGIGPFFKFTNIKVDDLKYRGAPATCDFEVAIAQAGQVQIELITQKCKSPSAYRDVYGPEESGFHHLGMFTDDFGAELARLNKAGFVKAAEGRVGEMQYAYVDTRNPLGCMLEIIAEDVSMRETFRLIKEIGDGWDGSRPVRSVEELAELM